MTRRVMLAFPLNHRRKLIAAIAQQMVARSPVEAEKHLQSQLRRQASALARRQFSDDVINAQIRAFEAAVRTELWRLVMTPPRQSSAGLRRDGQQDSGR